MHLLPAGEVMYGFPFFPLYKDDYPAHSVFFGGQIAGTLGLVRPDIVDYTPGVKEIGEIKPLSAGAALLGVAQLTAYLSIANGIGTEYKGRIWDLSPWMGGGWKPSTWPVGVRPVFPGRYGKDFKDFVAFTIANVNGLIFYERVNLRGAGALGVVAATVGAQAIAANVADGGDG